MEIDAASSLIGVLSRVPASVEDAWYPVSLFVLTTNGDSWTVSGGVLSVPGPPRDWARSAGSRTARTAVARARCVRNWRELDMKRRLGEARANGEKRGNGGV